MARLGSQKRPVTLRVQTMERAQEVAFQCDQLGLIYIVGVEPDKVEDLTDLERALSQPGPVKATVKIGRNDPCPCGSGKKFKKCCGQLSAAP